MLLAIMHSVGFSIPHPFLGHERDYELHLYQSICRSILRGDLGNPDKDLLTSSRKLRIILGLKINFHIHADVAILYSRILAIFLQNVGDCWRGWRLLGDYIVGDSAVKTQQHQQQQKQRNNATTTTATTTIPANIAANPSNRPYITHEQMLRR